MVVTGRSSASSSSDRDVLLDGVFFSVKIDFGRVVFSSERCRSSCRKDAVLVLAVWGGRVKKMGFRLPNSMNLALIEHPGPRAACRLPCWFKRAVYKF